MESLVIKFLMSTVLAVAVYWLLSQLRDNYIARIAQGVVVIAYIVYLILTFVPKLF